MAATKPVDEAPGTLKFHTWVLKVPIYCEGCKKEVKKLLQAIDGVYVTTVDSHQHKVTVIGNVSSETLIKKLTKSGKHAELWPEIKVTTDDHQKKDKKPGKAKNKDKDQEGTKEKADQKNSSGKPENTAKSGADDKPPAKDTGAGNGGNKKQKNTENAPSGAPAGSGSSTPVQYPTPQIPHMYFSHPDPPLYPYPPTPMYYGAPLYGVNYSAAHPVVSPSHYASPMHQNAYPPFDTRHNHDYADHTNDEGGCSII